jgi:hypothetical protein
LREIPYFQTRESFVEVWNKIRTYAASSEAPEGLVTWVEHKENNPWIFLCLCAGVTWMPRVIWSNTSFTTNTAESAHAYSQRYGIRMTLVGAIQQSKKIDEQFFVVQRSMWDAGIAWGYGNRSVSGRAKKNLVRKQKRAQKKSEREREKNIEQEDEDEGDSEELGNDMFQE